MIDTLLTIAGIGLYIPFWVQLFRTPWNKRTWSRQLVLLMLALELTTVLHVPSVMYISAGLLFAAVIMYCVIMRPQFRFTPLLIISALYVIYFAISILWSSWPERGTQFLIDNGLPVLGFAISASVLQVSKEEWAQILRTFCYAALIFVGLTILSWGVSCIQLHLAPWQWPFFHKKFIDGWQSFEWIFRFNGGMTGYSHPSYNLLTIFAATCAAMHLGKKRILHPSIGWLLWVGTIVITGISQSRMGLIYIVIIFIAGLIYLLPSIRTRLIAGGSIAAVGIIFLCATHSIWQQYGQDPIRNELYAKTWRYIQIKPWTGAGAGALNPVEICHTTGELYWPHIGYIAPDYNMYTWPWKTRMLPHNQWLADWAHAGIIAALITLALYIYMIVRSGRQKNYWGVVFMLIFCIFSCLEPPLYIGKGLYLFCLFGFFVQTYAERKE